MRILLAQNSVYVPAHGGANKSNRLLLEGLVARGHQCDAIAPALGVHACATRDAFLAELRQRDITLTHSTADVDQFDTGGVRVTAVASMRSFGSVLRQLVREREPDCVLVASEDPGQLLLETAVNAAPDRIVYLARTTLALPCGPLAAMRAPTRTALLRRAESVVAVSAFLRDYLARWADVEAIDLPICPNGPGPFQDHGAPDAGAVLMVNPCAYKGLPIFLELARAFPGLPFIAIRGWGTTSDDAAALAALPNVRVLDAVDDFERILADARVVVVPSLCAEGKANVITEAMLHGIPVLASDVGGNREAMLGIDHLLPVSPIERFPAPVQLDQRRLPIAEIPSQDVTPWRAALGTLLESPLEHRRISAAARMAALKDNETRGIAPFEQHLARLIAARQGTRN